MVQYIKPESLGSFYISLSPRQDSKKRMMVRGSIKILYNSSTGP